MKKITILLIALLTAFLAFSAAAETAGEAEEITAGCTVKCVDNSGRGKRMLDGKYTTYWESSKRDDPWIVISSEQPVYGLYLCFIHVPEQYVIQKESGDGWVTVCEGDSRFRHAYYELDGLKKIRIMSTMDRKNKMALNEIHAFGQGNAPDWVQRWEPTEEKADILFVVAHPDDELIFLGGAIPTYAVERKQRIVVAYLTPANDPARFSEALNGLWSMGVRRYPVFGSFSDHYAKTGKLADAYKETTGGKQAVWTWMTELYRKYRPEVVVTHDFDGEYGHPQHKMVADAAAGCYDEAADAGKYPESAAAYGTWQVRKLYIHLYGDEETQTVLDWEQPLASMGGKTGTQLASEAFEYHVSQQGKGAKIRGKRVPFSVEETGGKMYPNTRYGLYRTEVGEDVLKNDFLEHIMTETAETEPENDTPPENASETAEPVPENEPAEGDTAGIVISEEENPEGETPEEEIPEEMPEEAIPEKASEGESTGDETGNAAGGETNAAGETEVSGTSKAGAVSGTTFQDVTAPEWADVKLNARGFLDEGEYVFTDAENGRYMYVSQTLRVVVERSYEVPDKKHPFYCFTADVWCDVEKGELPQGIFNNPDPDKRSKSKYFAMIRDIASANHVVLATSTDYYTYRISQSYPTGIVIRNGEIIIDDPRKLQRSMPTYETLALYRDGHAESWANTEKTAEQYIQEGALQVYTFGPCLVKDGELTDYVLNLANSSYNPRLAAGVAEPGHYVVVMCEGRLARSKGVQMGTLAKMMQERGCQVAVNLDGGQTAVMTFMGIQLNQVVKSDPYGRNEGEILAFGISDQVGSVDFPDAYEAKIESK